MAGLSPRDHTAATLKRMNLAGGIPGNLDRNNDASADNYGLTAARSSDASSFKMTGAPKSPNLGRPGRAAGGRIAGDLIRTRRTPQETAKDIADEDSVADALGKDRATGGRIDRAYGGRLGRSRVGRWQGGPDRDVLGQKDVYATLPPDERPEGGFGPRDPLAKPFYNYISGGFGTRSVGAPYDKGGIGSDAAAEPPKRATGGRTNLARGGRAKGKTTVNVIIGGDKHLPPQGPPPMPPPPMAAPGPVGPPPGGPPPGIPGGGAPPGPPGMPPPGMPPMLRARGGRIGRQIGGAMPMPGVGAPPPAMGAPGPAMGSPLQPGAPPPMPPQGMPMRASGGRIEISTPGKHDYGKPGVKHGSTQEKYGGGSGLGRQERARHQK